MARNGEAAIQRETFEFQPDALVNAQSGKRYPIRDGIPIFLKTVSGQNEKYQALYDRIAVFYDVSEIGKYRSSLVGLP